MDPDESAEQVRTPPAERDGESRPAADIRQSRRFGRRLDTWGWLAMFGGAALVGIDVSGNSDGLGWAGVAQLVVGLIVVVFGLWAVVHGRRHRNVVLPDLGAVPEGEGAVLFLRAFSDERGFARTAASRPLRWVMWPPPITPSELRTEEDQLARAVAPFGRLVALGPTFDRLPRTGANRSYASDDEWQSKVLRALDRASLVLLAAGSGDQLEWEVEQVVHRDDPTAWSSSSPEPGTSTRISGKKWEIGFRRDYRKHPRRAPPAGATCARWSGSILIGHRTWNCSRAGCRCSGAPRVPSTPCPAHCGWCMSGRA